MVWKTDLRLADEDKAAIYGDCRFFPVGFGDTPAEGLECPLNELPDDWFFIAIDAHASDAKWNFSPAMEALLDALIRSRAIQCFLRRVFDPL